MKEGRPLVDLAAELERQVNAKRDYLAPAQDLRVRSNGTSRLVLEEPGQDFAVNDIAHGQVAEYLGIPKLFYDRLREEREATVPVSPEALSGMAEPDNPASTPLFDVLVNTLLMNRGGDRRLVRTLDGTARAFLSDSFNVDLDNFDVFRVAAKVIEEAGLGPDDVVSAEVTERKLYLKVVSPRIQATVKPANVLSGHGYLKEPQVVQAGFLVTNSETGLGSLSVQQVVYKLMCTNLWVKEEAYRQRHLGKALEADHNGGVYRSDTRLADARARLLKLRDHVAAALDETRFLQTVARMQEAAEVPLSGSVEKCVEAAAKKFALSQGEKEAVMRNLIEGADLSLWGLSNAVTAAAGQARDYDRSTDLEAIGGRMLSLPDAEIREIAGAS